jgi:hypothetical protein
MILNDKDQKRLQQQIDQATEKELEELKSLREKISKLNLIRMGSRQHYTIAPVATDGGENRLSFEPVNIEIIRVADSEGNKRIEIVVPLTSEVEVYKSFFEEIPVLEKYLSRLQVEYRDLSYLLPSESSDDDTPRKKAISSREYLRHLREIMEWAVLLDIAWSDSRPLVLRDGLLRTRSLKPSTVEKMRKSFKEAYLEKESLLVGVAKRSKVLNYVALSLALEGTFRKQYACFCEVPAEIEENAYNWARTWQKGDQVFGKLHLVKLIDEPRGIILPIDIPEWLLDRRKEVLEYLSETARRSWPVVGYPHPLVKAHEYAVIGGFEVDIISSMLEKSLVNLHNTKDVSVILELIYIGRGLKTGGGT